MAGGLAFVVVLGLSRPLAVGLLASVPLVVLGLATRVWGKGYIGPDSRSSRIGARRLVTGGPYRRLRLSHESVTGHPLYIGNFFLVTGALVALNPGLVPALSVVALFLLEYWLIARAEEEHLRASRQLAASSLPPATEAGFRLRWASGEWRTVATLVLVYGAAVLRRVGR